MPLHAASALAVRCLEVELLARLFVESVVLGHERLDGLLHLVDVAESQNARMSSDEVPIDALAALLCDLLYPALHRVRRDGVGGEHVCTLLKDVLVTGRRGRSVCCHVALLLKLIGIPCRAGQFDLSY